MVDLYIDGHRVVLPENWNTTLVEENPFITQKGEYTYDITLSLLNPINARIYKNMHRPNTSQEEIKGRRAILIVSGRVVFRGVEIIGPNTESSVEIQLAANESEFNYVLGEDKKLRDIDLGTCEGFKHPPLTPEFREEVTHQLSLRYPDAQWQALSFASDEDFMAGNRHSPSLKDSLYGADFSEKDFFPQPYLCFIIKQVFAYYGFKMIEDDLSQHPFLGQAYIVNGIYTMRYAEMMPDWTVEEFLNEIEFLFGCTFIINSRENTVKLIFNYNRELTDAENNIIKTDLEVVDQYERVPDDENRLVQQNSNIGYDLDDEEFYHYMRMPDFARELMGVEHITNIPYQDYLTYVNGLKVVREEDLREVFKFPDIDTMCVIVKEKDRYTLRPVESFRELINNFETKEIDRELKIIPAPMTWDILGGAEDKHFYLQNPISEVWSGYWWDVDKEELPTLQDVIEGGEEAQKPLIPSKIRLAIYTGKQRILNKEESFTTELFYPITYVESLAEFCGEAGKEWHFGEKGVNPLRLHYLRDDIYSKAKNIDTTREYVFTFVMPPIWDIRSVFNIRNKEYICSKIEREITTDGFSTFAKGYFYPRS